MRDRELRHLLGSGVLPEEAEARERSWQVVRAAYDAREPLPRARRRLAPALALGLGVVVLAAALSPPGRAVVESVRRAVGVERAAPELFQLPAPGRLLVVGSAGAWVVHADGSRRFLGQYREATWSPHGRFVLGLRSNALVALERNGTTRWTLPRPLVRHARWTGTLVDTRIAYLSNRSLRVVAGDGRGDRQIVTRVAPVAPAWRPGRGYVLAVAEPGGRISAVDTERNRVLWRTTRRAPPIVALEWSSDGRRLLAQRKNGAAIDDDVSIYTASGQLWTGVRIPSAGVTAASFRPGSHGIAFATAEGGRGRVHVAGKEGGLVFAGAGRFASLTWSPDGRWLLIPWREASQWLFVRARRHAGVSAVANVSSQFNSATFPSPAGWCCSVRGAAG